jgi:glycosyltransferase involved in cell wall biosynthesis
MVNLAPPGHFDKVILESLACGTPVIIANTDLRGHIDGRCLIDPADAESLAARLEGFFEMPETERSLIGEAARTYVVREHGVNALMERIVHMCRGT